MDKAQPSLGQSSIDQQIQISLYQALESAYSSLHLKEIVHPYWIVSHVLQGEVETITYDKSVIARPGDVMVHPPNIPFSELSNGSGLHQWIGFHVSVMHNLDLFHIFPVTLVVKLSSPDVFSSLFREFLKSWQEDTSLFRDFNSSAYVATLLSLILGSFRSQSNTGHTTVAPSHQDGFHILIRHMMENFRYKMSRSDLAARLNLHPVYMDRIFMNSYGMTPMQMLREVRLRRAKQMLESSNETLALIAHNCGFNDAAYLSKVFYKEFEQTPGQYREHVKLVKANYLN